MSSCSILMRWRMGRFRRDAGRGCGMRMRRSIVEVERERRVSVFRVVIRARPQRLLRERPRRFGVCCRSVLDMGESERSSHGIISEPDREGIFFKRGRHSSPKSGEQTRRVSVASAQSVARGYAQARAQGGGRAKVGDQLAYERRLAEIDASKKHSPSSRSSHRSAAREKQLGLHATLGADREVRALAVTVIGRLPPEELSKQAPLLMLKLEDPDDGVCQAAAASLARFEPAALEPHAAMLVGLLEASSSGAREAAVATLALCEQHTLCCVSEDLGALLEHSHHGVRASALSALSHLPPNQLAGHAEAVVASLEDNAQDVRAAATVAISRMAERQDVRTRFLQPLAERLTARLSDPEVNADAAARKAAEKSVVAQKELLILLASQPPRDE